MLMHAMAQWPSVITEEFWSYAFAYATHINNNVPRVCNREDNPTSPVTKTMIDALFPQREIVSLQTRQRLIISLFRWKLH